jgi:hypothetical protein
MKIFGGKAIAIVDICGVRKSERNILNKLSRNLSSHFSITVLARSVGTADDCLHATQKW